MQGREDRTDSRVSKTIERKPYMDTADFVSRVKRVRLDSVSPSKHNPRGSIERNESFERLAASIEKVGILVPLVVRESPSGSKSLYELVDGERRYLAAKELGLPVVPAHIVHAGTTWGF